MSDLSVDKCVRVYIKMRDAKAAVERDAEEKVKKIEEDMRKVEAVLLEHCKEHNVNSVNTNEGTFIRTTKTRYWTSDWDSMNKFITENEVYDLYEKRLHQGNVKTWLEEHPDKLPPGLNVDSSYAITVRKPK